MIQLLTIALLFFSAAKADETTLQKNQMDSFLAKISPIASTRLKLGKIKLDELYDLSKALAVLDQKINVPVFLTIITRHLTSIIERSFDYPFLIEAQDLNEAIKLDAPERPPLSTVGIKSSIFDIFTWLCATALTENEIIKTNEILKMNKQTMHAAFLNITQTCEFELTSTPLFLGSGNYLVYEIIEAIFDRLSKSSKEYRVSLKQFNQPKD